MEFISLGQLANLRIYFSNVYNRVQSHISFSTRSDFFHEIHASTTSACSTAKTRASKNEPLQANRHRQPACASPSLCPSRARLVGAHPRVEEAQSLLLDRRAEGWQVRGLEGREARVAGTLCLTAQPESCLLFKFSFAVKELRSLHCRQPPRSGNRLAQTEPSGMSSYPLSPPDSAPAVSQDPRLPSGHQAGGRRSWPG